MDTTLGFSLTNAQGPGDCYSVDVATGKVERWTTSESAGEDRCLSAKPELVHWKSFDGKMISGFLYQAAGAIYGETPGAGGDSRRSGGPIAADFSGARKLFLNELGIAIIYPERARVDRIRQDVFAAGQRIQARGHLQGYQRAV